MEGVDYNVLTFNIITFLKRCSIVKKIVYIIYYIYYFLVFFTSPRFLLFFPSFSIRRVFFLHEL